MSACLFLAQSEHWSWPYRALLVNIGIDASTLPSQGPALVLADRVAKTVNVLQPGQDTNSSFGAISLSTADDGAFSVKLGGTEILLMNTEATTGIVAMSNDYGLQTAPSQFSSGPDGITKIQ